MLLMVWSPPPTHTHTHHITSQKLTFLGALTFAIKQLPAKIRSPSPVYRNTNNQGPVIVDLDDDENDMVIWISFQIE